MALGTAHAGSCWPTQIEAGELFCSSVGGTAASGTRQCVGVAGLSSEEGGPVSFTWTMRRDGLSATDAPAAGYLPGCETYGIDWWGPILGIAFGALVVLMCAKLIARPFTHDRTTA